VIMESDSLTQIEEKLKRVVSGLLLPDSKNESARYLKFV
jgi:hypothetical protein